MWTVRADGDERRDDFGRRREWMVGRGQYQLRRVSNHAPASLDVLAGGAGEWIVLGSARHARAIGRRCGNARVVERVRHGRKSGKRELEHGQRGDYYTPQPMISSL